MFFYPLSWKDLCSLEGKNLACSRFYGNQQTDFPLTLLAQAPEDHIHMSFNMDVSCMFPIQTGGLVSEADYRGDPGLISCRTKGKAAICFHFNCVTVEPGLASASSFTPQRENVCQNASCFSLPAESCTWGEAH